MIYVYLSKFIRKIRASRPWGIGAIAGLLLFAIFGNAICFYFLEGAQNSEIDFEDSLWYSVISITTIGYGDFYPETTAARITSFLFVILLGLTTFSLFFGMLIEWFTEIALRGDRGMSTVHAKNHTLIVHFPSEARVRQLIRELQTDGSEIVVIADRIESLPFQEKNVSFVRGSTVSEETYRRASIETAKKAVVLSTSYEETNSDAVVASAASVIDHLKPSIHLVAECLDDQHRMLFNSVNADAVVSVMRITGNLLVQESQDPGVSQLFDIITSNLEGDVIYSCQVDSDSPSAYSEIAKQLLDRDINLLAVTRGKETHTAFSRIQPQKGDHVVYLAPQRQQWSDLRV